MPPDAIARLEAALTAAGVVFRGEVYPARHGWAVADSPAYDRDAAERHWTALLDHLAAAFPHRGSRRDDPARVMSGTGKATVRTGKSG
jgi:dienelactone hydrolase